jgi:hypothetical protein
MKKRLMISLLLISIFAFPLLSAQYNAYAGRSTMGDGGDYCECASSTSPCYDDVTGDRCDSGGRYSMSDGTKKAPSTPGSPIDLSSGLLLFFVAAYLTARFTRMP